MGQEEGMSISSLVSSSTLTSLKVTNVDGLDEPGGPVDVPHPGVLEGQLEEDLPATGAYLDVNGVCQVEPPLGLHHVGEQGATSRYSRYSESSSSFS